MIYNFAQYMQAFDFGVREVIRYNSYMISMIFVNILGVLIFLFIFWRRLKEDFASEIIFNIAFNVLIGIGIFISLSITLIPDYFLLLGFTGGLGGIILSVFKYKIKFFEIFEAYIFSVLPWVSLLFLNDSVLHSSLSSFLGFIVILILVFISYYLGSHYKNFSWYKSGKIGFAGLSVLGIVFIIRFILALGNVRMLSLVNKEIEIAVSALGFVACLVLLFNLGKEKA